MHKEKKGTKEKKQVFKELSRLTPNPKHYQKLRNNMDFKPLQYHEYSKLSSKAKETYNKGEREYNFNRKMEKKYGSGSKSRAIKKLSKMFK